MTELQIGKEYPQPDEEKFIAKIVALFKKTLGGYYPTGLTKRIFHPKMHALLRAEFVVEKNLPDDLVTDLLKPGKTYDAWIRLSNAKKKASHDKQKDMRGMAIKLVGVSGEKVLENEKDALTHDFVLVTTRTLQTRSVKDFWKSLDALMGGPLKLLFYAISHLPVVWRSLKQISKCASLLEASFFSTTPYKYGKKGLTVKYAVVPETERKSSFPENPSFNFLSERLAADLAENDFYFSFMIQPQTDAYKTPVEDPTVEWKSPYTKVATIRIPKQVFGSKAQTDYGENLSFTPWHCIEDHRPMGGVNRARRDVYIALSEFRHKRNGMKQEEPVAMKSFEGEKVH